MRMPHNSEVDVNMRNPILPIADPFVTRHDGCYYVTGTSTGASIHIWAASTLDGLSAAPLTIAWNPRGDQPAHQIWSPSMYLLPYRGADQWFIYCTASLDDTNRAHRIYALRSDGEDPLGPYTFEGQVAGMSDATAIDPSLLRLGGHLYLLYVEEPGNGPAPEANVVYIAPLSDPLTLSAPGRPLIYPDQPWERGGDEGHSPYPVAEGPIALHHDGRAFIVYSGSHTGNHTYCLGLLAYDGVGDPLDVASWTKSGPVFSYSEANGVYGPGRASFTTTPDGEDWMVYHAKADRAYSYRGRTTRAQRFTWNADGTPSFGVPVPVDQADIPTRVVPRSNQ